MKREKRRPMSFRSIAVRFIALTMTLWLTAAGLLTWAVAADFYTKLEAYAYEDARMVAGVIKPNDGGFDEIDIINALWYPYRHWPDPLLPIVGDSRLASSSDDRLWGQWDLVYGYEAAVATYATYSAEMDPLIQTGNYIIFEYTTQENWAVENVEPVGECYLALDEIEGGMDALGRYLDSDPHFPLAPFMPVCRISGYFEGQRFHPVTLEAASVQGFSDTLKNINFCDVRRENIVEWDVLLSLSDKPDRELQTIYAWHRGVGNSDTEPVTVNGTDFSSLPELLHADMTGSADYERKSLLDAVIVTACQGEYGVAAVAIRCWPLQYAALRLVPFYLITLAVLGLTLWLILWKIYRNLTSPLLDLAVSTGISQPTGWWEPYEIKKKLNEARQALAEANTKLTQTQTALDYARHAEENRKKLVSDLAHELKTPLAIIHSYAEGLQEGIAEDKKEQYLSVILEQSEQMDALVLQMLDLSRLEAGKVRLTVEPVALLKLTKAVTDRFAPLLEEKELTLHYDMAEDLTVTADEARLEQVVTNLVSNAVKYTPAGGSIRINMYLLSGKVYFFMENTAPHLSDEALEKVWDSFYRADPSRTEPGTGLGLALVKGIIQLHRGECSVRNVTVNGGEPAVEFGFTLPVD